MSNSWTGNNTCHSVQCLTFPLEQIALRVETSPGITNVMNWLNGENSCASIKSQAVKTEPEFDTT